MIFLRKAFSILRVEWNNEWKDEVGPFPVLTFKAFETQVTLTSFGKLKSIAAGYLEMFTEF